MLEVASKWDSQEWLCKMWRDVPVTTIKVKEPTLRDMKSVKALVEEKVERNVTMDELIKMLLNLFRSGDINV